MNIVKKSTEHSHKEVTITNTNNKLLQCNKYVNYKFLKLYYSGCIIKYLNNIFQESIYSTKLTVYVTFQIIYETEHCINKQYIVSGDTYYVPNSKLSASSVFSWELDVIYSRLTNEHDYHGSWTAGVNRDDQFIQVSFIFLKMLGRYLLGQNCLHLTI